MIVDSGLRAVFLAERAMLLRFLRARLGSPDDAEDALQEMWFKVEQATARPVADPAAYLFRMAANLATDRRISGDRRGSLETAWHDVQPGSPEHPDAERLMLSRERLGRAQAVLSAMPERMRLAYTMFRLEELPQRAIAERLGVSLSAVEKLLQRAYARFHGIEGHGDDQP